MVFGKKEEKKTMAEAIVLLRQSMEKINSRLDKIEQQPKEVKQEVKPEVTPEAKPVSKKEELAFMIYDQPIKHKRIIIDNTDKENPIIYDVESALAKILNDVAYLRKALA